MPTGAVHLVPAAGWVAEATKETVRCLSLVELQTITAFPAETAIWGPWTSSLTGAMVTGGDQPLPGRRLLTWTRSGWPPDQVAIASPSGVTATAGAPASRLDGPTTVGEAHRGAASAAETMAIVAATTSATGTARVRRGLMNPG